MTFIGWKKGGRSGWVVFRFQVHSGRLGHSDADVVCHVLCDALLGAANMRNIGYHFSDKDPRWKGVDSKLLLAEVLRMVRGSRLRNLECRCNGGVAGAEAQSAHSRHENLSGRGNGHSGRRYFH